ncbi:MAG: DUF296 domain-containing protein [archaeon]
MTETLTLIVQDGEDIFNAIEDFTKQNDIGYGMVVSAKGAMKKFNLIGHGRKGTIDNVSNTAEFEVDAMSGKIQKKGDKVTVKMNALVSSSGFTPLSGELISGKASGKLVIGIKKIDLKKMIEA